MELISSIKEYQRHEVDEHSRDNMNFIMVKSKSRKKSPPGIYYQNHK